MKNTVKNRLQSTIFSCNLKPDCSNLQSTCKLISLIYKCFFANFRLQSVDCKDPLQSTNILCKSITCGKLKIARTPLSLRERDKPRLRGVVSDLVPSGIGGDGGAV